MKSPRVTFVLGGLVVGGILGLSFCEHLHGQAASAPPPAVMPAEITSFRDVVKQALPAVVSLESRVKPKKDEKKEKPNLPLGIPEELIPYFEGPTRDEGLIGTGSGAIVDAAGVIVTNFHVIEGADFVNVTLHDGRKYVATDIRRDPKTDLAVLKIKVEKPLPFLKWEDSEVIEVGDRVLAMGSPFGFSSTVTHGIISAKGRNNQRINQYEDFLQTDAAINPGNSGGALIGLNGKLFGINSNIYTRSGGFQGIGFAISSNLAKEVTRQLLLNGSVKRGYLGVGIRDLDPVVAEKVGVKSGGVLITKVYDKTPAALAGLKTGDIIVAIGGNPVKDSYSLPRVVAMQPLNTAAAVAIIRGNKPQTVEVTILEQPEEFGQDRSTSGPLVRGAGLDIGGGITVMLMTDELAKQFGYSKGIRATVISSVAKDSAAAKAGLVRGMIIQRIDTTVITSPEVAEKAFAKADKAKGAALEIVKADGFVDFITVPVK